jgi:hypothetical protein
MRQTVDRGLRPLKPAAVWAPWLGQLVATRWTELGEIRDVGAARSRSGPVDKPRLGHRADTQRSYLGMNESASTATVDIPQFGALLAPVLAQVPGAARPRFLAMLERIAADRYRAWAAAADPRHRDVLLACAAGEDEIADRIDAAFRCDDATLDELRALLPQAEEIYLAAFEGRTVMDQIRIQAGAELQGALAWVHIAERLDESPASEQLRDVLAACSALEEHSSHLVTTKVLAG